MSFFLIFNTIDYFIEKKEWNNGFCLKTKLPWQYIKTSKDGKRLYQDGSGNLLWITYKTDKHE